MEMEKTQNKTPFYKNKAVIIPVSIALSLAVLVMAAVIYQSLNATVEVSEAFSTTTVDFNLAGFPGETLTQVIVVDNAANVALNTEVTWEETLNPDLVTYMTNMPIIQEIPSGEGNNITATWTINEDSPVGNFSGSVTLTRTA